MAHNLDINNGIASFASARVDAWHQLGTVIDKDGLTAQEALDAGHLSGWNIRKEPAFANVGDQQLPIPGCNAVIRNNPVIKGQNDVLGFVGNSHRVHQPEELTQMLDTIVDDSGAHYQTVGAIDRGKKVFITMKLPGHMLVGGVDQVDNYLAVVDSYDGSSSTVFMVTPVRVVCENTLNFALGDHKSIIRVRHTRGSAEIIRHEARAALDLTFGYLDEFNVEAEKLINTTMSQNRFEELIQREFGVADDAPKATVTRTENKLDEMARLFADSFTHEGVRGTAWAGLNALSEWYDHFSPTKGTERETSRALNALFYPEFKDRARKMVLAEAGLA